VPAYSDTKVQVQYKSARSHDLRLVYGDRCYKCTIMLVNSRSLLNAGLVNDQKERVHDDVKVEGREGVARVIIIPQANLDWHNNGRVQQKDPTVEIDH
jgi:hypothetical protein